MSTAWSTFTLDDWSTFSLDDWASFILDPLPMIALFIESAQVHRGGADASKVFHGVTTSGTHQSCAMASVYKSVDAAQVHRGGSV